MGWQWRGSDMALRSRVHGHGMTKAGGGVEHWQDSELSSQGQECQSRDGIVLVPRCHCAGAALLLYGCHSDTTMVLCRQCRVLVQHQHSTGTAPVQCHCGTSAAPVHCQASSGSDPRSRLRAAPGRTLPSTSGRITRSCPPKFGRGRGMHFFSCSTCCTSFACCRCDCRLARRADVSFRRRGARVLQRRRLGRLGFLGLGGGGRRSVVPRSGVPLRRRRHQVPPPPLPPACGHRRSTFGPGAPSRPPCRIVAGVWGPGARAGNVPGVRQRVLPEKGPPWGRRIGKGRGRSSESFFWRSIGRSPRSGAARIWTDLGTLLAMCWYCSVPAPFDHQCEVVGSGWMGKEWARSDRQFEPSLCRTHMAEHCELVGGGPNFERVRSNLDRVRPISERFYLTFVDTGQT